MDSGLYLRMFSQPDDARACMLDIGVCPDALDIMLPKMRHLAFMIRGLDPRAANILKQEMLAVGGEAATSYHVICDLSKPTDCLLAGTERQLSIVIPKLACQPFGLAKLASAIDCAIRALSSSNCRNFGQLELGNRTILMGILNVTPDSFSGDGTTDVQTAIDRGLAMSSQGASIIDVGGESTRPGADQPMTEEELARVIPVIEGLASRLNIPISIDSRNPEVVRRSLAAGASIVNLVGGLRSREMARVIAEAGAPVILMHMQGEPGDMQQNPIYSDVVDDIVSELRRQISSAIEAGITSENIAIDPGIGFGKAAEHNLEILRRLGEFRILGVPIVIGTSRKSFIGKVLGTEVDDRLEGSLATAVLASAQGADIVRAHDVKETARAIRMADAVSGDKQRNS